VVPVPKFGPRLLLGREAADEVVSASQRVMPVVLARDGYQFRHETVDEAVRAELA
jgi:NAD dependent epimerase/dehydratase family enzyme